MAGKRKTSIRRRRVVKGAGLISSIVNKAVDLLPFEAHLPGYNYCGPGTKLAKRLARGDKGINGLDEACKLHDIAYSKYKDNEHRNRADKELAERAWRRFKSSDASLGEKAAAWAVTTAMKTKTKFGGGKKTKKRAAKRQRQDSTKGKGLYLRPYPKQGAGKRKKKISKKKAYRSR
jgi:hypothetical protein